MIIHRLHRCSYSSRVLVFFLALTLSVLSLILSASAQRQKFYIEPGASDAGAYHPPVILVKAVKDRNVYDTVDIKQGVAGDMTFYVKVRGSCMEKFRTLSAHIYIIGKTKQRDPDFEANSDHRSIGPNHGADWEYHTFSVPFIMPNLDDNKSPIDVCNTELQRANSDAARTRLLESGFNIEFARAYTARIDVLCDLTTMRRDEDFSEYGTALYPAVVRCMPTKAATKPAPPRPGRPIDFDPPIESVTLAADPPNTQGRQCPVYVNFKGRIAAGEKSQYTTFNTKYRFIGDNNYKTDWQNVSIERGQPRPVYGRRFIEAPVRDPGGGFKTPGGSVKIPVYQGWMMLEVMLPDGTKRSERANFSVDCNVQPRIRPK
ncbi:MAG TPA: hypothetical protein VKB46_07540 [Pyrinomonadaceae bacterium]|nr:hypothetical protein [Pyrinomonadaceae bacterium]